jgi:HD superfamily phosphodiesterase
MSDFFGDDTRRINHAKAVFHYATLIEKDEGGNLDVIEISAALHDVGIPEAERKYNSSAGHYQEIEGPPIARKLLSNLDLPENDVDHICKIIANHHSGKNINTLEFKIIWDSDWLVNIEDIYDVNNKTKMKKLIDNIFKTKNGKKLAIQKFL